MSFWLSYPSSLVRPDLVGDPRPQDLRLAQRGVRRRLNEDLLTAPHDVLVLDPIIVHADLAPADAVVEIAGVGTDHRLGELGHSLRGIGPRPGGGEHADRAHGSDLVVEHLMDVTVDVGDLGIRLQHVIDFAPVTHPEVPRRVVLVERIMAEDNDRPGLIPIGEDLLEPFELVPTHAGPLAGDAAVEGRHVAHALLGTHLTHRPVVRAATDRVEADKAHTLVIESPVGLAEELPPLLSHVQIPVVLARDEDLPRLYLFKELIAELEFLDFAELRQVAAKDHEVGRRVHSLDLVRCAHHLFDEARVERPRIEMGVGNPGKLEGLLGSVGDVDRVEQRPPCKSLSNCSRAGQTRFVDESAPSNPERGDGTNPRPLEHRDHLTSVTIKLRHVASALDGSLAFYRSLGTAL